MPTISDDNGGMTRNLDTALLRSFLAVADHASMTAAARILNLTQGAVSQQIARLEALVGASLFIRDRSGLRPTAIGERLLRKSRRLLALNDEIWDDITGGAIDGPVRIGVPYDLVAPCIAPMLRRFAAACPQVDLSLVCGSSTELAAGIADGSLDLAVVEESVETAGGEHLMTDRLVWVGARGGHAHSLVPLPLSLVVETCVFRPVVMTALRRQGREWRVLFDNGGLDATFATVRTDLAVSAWLAFTVPPDLEILSAGSGLPDLPSFAVTLHRSARPPSLAAVELARRLRDAFVHVKRAG
jgi:DNA-binding transcriptional LysR family regulator